LQGLIHLQLPLCSPLQLKIGDVDVVFCGKQSTDGSTGVVGAELAAILGFSQLTYVSKIRQIDAAGKKIVVERAIEGATKS